MGAGPQQITALLTEMKQTIVQRSAQTKERIDQLKQSVLPLEQRGTLALALLATIEQGGKRGAFLPDDMTLRSTRAWGGSARS